MISGGKIQKTILTCVAIAIIAKSLWFNLMGYSPAFVSAANTAFISAGRVGFMVTSVVFLVIFALLGRKAIELRGPLFYVAPILMLMGTGMFGLAENQSSRGISTK